MLFIHFGAGLESNVSCSLEDLYFGHYGYASDKWISYLKVYDRFFQSFRYKSFDMIEIGVQNGGSLAIWSDYFANANKIIGCDIDEKCSNLVYEDKRVNVVVGDINLEKIRKKIYSEAPNPFLIIDDGSHSSPDIINTFKYFYPLLMPGGLYVIEDLHCSYWSQFKGGLWRNNSAIEFFKLLIDVINIEHWGVDFALIKKISRYKRSKIMRVGFDDFASINSIYFFNSMCLIEKGFDDINTIGHRVVSGNQFPVQTNIPSNGSLSNSPFQKNNYRKLRR